MSIFFIGFHTSQVDKYFLDAQNQRKLRFLSFMMCCDKCFASVNAVRSLPSF